MMRIVYSLLFTLILSIPLVLGFSPLQGRLVPHDIHAKTPGWHPEALTQRDYYLAWRQFIRERIATWPHLTAMKRRLDLRLFAVSDVKDIHVGRNGWLYAQTSLQSFRKQSCRDQKRVQSIFSGLKTITDVSGLCGYPVVVSIAPDKATIYPEYMGKVPRDPDCGHSAYDLWLDAQAGSPMNSFVRLDEELRTAKTAGALYSPTGTTWTTEGVDAVSAPLLNPLLGRRLPGIQAEDLSARLLGESDTQSNPREPDAIKVDGHLSSVLVYGGAQAAMLLPWLARGFDRVDRIDSLEIPSPSHHERLQDYDAVLILIEESRLTEVRIDMDRWCAMLPLDRTPHTRSPIPLNTIRAERRLSVDTEAGVLMVKSMGADARFILPALPGSEADTLRLLRLKITAPQADTLTWSDQLGTMGQNSRTLRPGDCEVYLPLAESPSVRMSINPGQRTGIFRVSAADVLEFGRTHGKGPSLTTAELTRPDAAERTNGSTTAPDSDTTAPPTTSRDARDTSPPAVKLKDVENGRIFQRKGNSADIIVSGSYSGRPEAIEARVVRHNTNEVVIPWTVIDSAPAEGIFMGILPEVPQGGWYEMAVRIKGQPKIMDRGNARWGVGILVACIGQSNMKEWFHSGSDLSPHHLAGLYRDGHWQDQALQGNGAIAFSNRLIARTAVPVGLLDYAVNGSGLLKEADWGTGYWADQRPGSIYRKLVNAVADTGGALEYVLWMQGEADAARGTIGRRSYEQGLTAFVDQQIRKDIINGSTGPELPFLIVGMVKRPVGKDIPHQAIRDAQQAVSEHVPGCYAAAVTLDLKNQGRQHLAPEAYTILGLRTAQTVLYLLGEESYYRGPSVAGSLLVDPQTIDVHLMHRGGHDFTPQSHITGWEVLQGLQPLSIQEVWRQDPATVRIRLAEPVAGPLKVRYLYGAMPDARNPVRDDSAIELPLEPFEGIIP